VEKRCSVNNKWHMLQDGGVWALPTLAIATRVTYDYVLTPLFWGMCFFKCNTYAYIYI